MQECWKLIDLQYYRPWDLRADEEDRIDAQIKEAQTRIDRELDEFSELYQRNGKINADTVRM